MIRKCLWAIAALSVLVAGCSKEAGLSAEETRNLKEGMSADKVKEIGPAPTPPSGPMKGYDGGSAADKAQGR
jgi:hypothetical protein